jgi:hypothetical protein
MVYCDGRRHSVHVPLRTIRRPPQIQLIDLASALICERRGRYRVARLVAEHGADWRCQTYGTHSRSVAPWSGTDRRRAVFYYADLAWDFP